MKRFLILVIIVSACVYMWKSNNKICQRFLCYYRWHEIRKEGVKEREIKEYMKYMSRETAEEVWNAEYEWYQKLYK